MRRFVPPLHDQLVQGARRATRSLSARRGEVWHEPMTSAYSASAPGPMSLRLAALQDRYRASVLGFAIGDALGFPFRGLPPQGSLRAQSMAEDFAPRPRGRFPKGQFSDDTQVMLAVADAVSKEERVDGKSAAQRIAFLWQEGVILHPPQAATDAAHALLDGTPWMSSGAALGIKDPSSLSRGVVVGLWSEDSPPRVAHAAHVLTVMTHKDPACAAAAAALGRAVQLGLADVPLTPGVFCEELSKAAAACDPELADELYYLPRALAWDVDRALAALRCVGVPPSQLAAEPGLPAHVTPVLLTGLYAALRFPTDFRAALAAVLKCGGEVDVAAGVTGAVLGARLGTDGIPARLKKNVMYVDELVAAADRLFDARMVKESVAATVTASTRR